MKQETTGARAERPTADTHFFLCGLTSALVAPAGIGALAPPAGLVSLRGLRVAAALSYDGLARVPIALVAAAAQR